MAASDSPELRGPLQMPRAVIPPQRLPSPPFSTLSSVPLPRHSQKVAPWVKLAGLGSVSPAP